MTGKYGIGLLVLVLASGPAWACSEARTVYVFDNDNASWAAYGDNPNPGPSDPTSGENIRMSIRFLPEWKLELTKNGNKTVMVTGGMATGFAWRMASVPGSDNEQDMHRYRIFDLSKIAKKGAPKEVMVFDDDLFWPTCR
jgi:hypothetical protein